MRIVILGHVCIDKNSSEHASYTSAGSPAMFMNLIFTQLPNCEVTIITPYGADFLPFMGSAHLFPSSPTQEKTLVYENNTSQGKRIQKAHNRQYATTIPMTPDMEISIKQADILIIAPLLPNISSAYIKSVVEKTSPNTIKVLSPQGYYRAFTSEDIVTEAEFSAADEILNQMDIVIVSDQDRKDMQQTLRHWTEKHPKLVAVMTKSKDGAIVLKGNKETVVRVEEVKEEDIVDSVGSGDIFTAGFAYNYWQTRDIQQAGDFANALARQCLFFKPNDIKIQSQALNFSRAY